MPTTDDPSFAARTGKRERDEGLAILVANALRKPGAPVIVALPRKSRS